MSMEMENQPILATNMPEDIGGNVKMLMMKWVRHWYWFLLSVLLTLMVTYSVLRYVKDTFQVRATVLIKDEKGGAGVSETAAFEDLGLLKGANNLENEIEIYKSRSLMMRVVRSLNHQISYIGQGNVVENELYKTSPVQLEILEPDSVKFWCSGTILIRVKSETEFAIVDESEKKEQVFQFGTPLNGKFAKYRIVRSSRPIKRFINEEIRIKVAPLMGVVAEYLGTLQVVPINKSANVIELSMRHTNIAKAIDILNNLMLQHNIDQIEDKNKISLNTSEFISNRLDYITTELSSVEGEAQGFKQEHNLVDVQSQAGQMITKDAAAEQQYLTLNTQLKLVDYVEDYIKKHNNNTDLIPSNIGLSDASVTANTTTYNQLILDRGRILKSSSEMNPIVENMNAQLASLRQSLLSSVENYRNTVNIQLRDISTQMNIVSSQISSVPKFERQFRSIERQQQIKEQLYLYLLQKREETNIALAITVANTKTIDEAYSDGVPVSPNRSNSLVIALALGLLIPAVIIYLREMLDTKVHTPKDIERYNLPYLGDIPLTADSNKLLVTKGDSSRLSEAFRHLRTNIDFLVNRANTDSNIIFVTSSVAKEGKSFIALN
ncbi:MAG: hypothetical protein FGM54_06690, partial [Chitinophagaceae bacterium]|nr:hypothetical protein [Chitinophagaceae bacterium]